MCFVCLCAHSRMRAYSMCVGMEMCAQAYICSYLFSSLLHLLPLLNSAGWPPASLLLATNWKALIIRWTRPSDSDVCQSCSFRQPRPSALSSLSLSTVGWQQLSFTFHPLACLILIILLIGIKLNAAVCTGQTQGGDSKEKYVRETVQQRAHIFKVVMRRKAKRHFCLCYGNVIHM